jgi:RNA polymerase sigma-70 factor (ECF subfamily)
MVDVGWVQLRDMLTTQYEDLIRSLTRRLGSSEAATEALHDTYLRMERGGDLRPVAAPRAYILKMAANFASNRRRANKRLLSAAEISVLLDRGDDAPGPDRIVEARDDMTVVLRALDGLPAVRRDIFLASWAERLPHAEIAARFKVHIRTVQKEIRRAEIHVRAAFSENASAEGRNSSVQVSSEKGRNNAGPK